jgi:hypothetical protein
MVAAQAWPVAPGAGRLIRGPRIVRSWDRLAPWWPWPVGPGAWPVGPAAGAGRPGGLGPAAGTVGRGARPWCRWPCLCLYVARSRVCMSGLARTNTQGRAAGTVAGGRGPRRLGRVAWAVAAGSRALARGQRPGHPGAQKTGRVQAARALARFYAVSGAQNSF